LTNHLAKCPGAHHAQQATEFKRKCKRLVKFATRSANGLSVAATCIVRIYDSLPAAVKKVINDAMQQDPEFAKACNAVRQHKAARVKQREQMKQRLAAMDEEIEADHTGGSMNLNMDTMHLTEDEEEGEEPPTEEEEEISEDEEKRLMTEDA